MFSTWWMCIAAVRQCGVYSMTLIEVSESNVCLSSDSFCDFMDSLLLRTLDFTPDRAKLNGDQRAEPSHL